MTRPLVLPSLRRALCAAVAVAVLFTLLAMLRSPATLSATAPAAASHYSVQIENYAYSPASITVNVGDTITWTNQDTAPHTVTTTSGPQALNSPTLSKGQSWSFTFTESGTYAYYCAVHPYMRAQVVVRAAAAPTTHAATTHAVTPAEPRTQTSYFVRTSHTAAPSRQPSTHATTSAPAAAVPSATQSPSATAQLQEQQAASTDNIRTLSPVLLLGGLTAAIAVFCLLLLGSRAAPASPTGSDQRDDAAGD